MYNKIMRNEKHTNTNYISIVKMFSEKSLPIFTKITSNHI